MARAVVDGATEPNLGTGIVSRLGEWMSDGHRHPLFGGDPRAGGGATGAVVEVNTDGRLIVIAPSIRGPQHVGARATGRHDASDSDLTAAKYSPHLCGVCRAPNCAAREHPVLIEESPMPRFAHRLTPRFAMLLTVALTGLAGPLSAQTISVSILDSATVYVAPGAKLAVPLRVDLSAAGTTTFAALQGALTWSASRLTFDSLRVVSSTGFSLTANTASAGTGTVSFNAFGTTALAVSGPLAMAYFTAGSGTGGTLLTLVPTVAGSEAGGDILALLRVRNLGVCVAPAGAWGDANDDGAVNVIDAQQIARFSVGLSVANSAVMVARGDVTADGLVNVIDAQQIARSSVALTAAARVNTALYTPPEVAALTVSPGGAQLLRTATTLSLTAEPRDGSSSSIAGCRPVTWTSSNPAIATVSSVGLVSGVSEGTVSITATSGSISSAVAISVTPVASVVANPVALTLLPGQTYVTTASVRDASGASLTGRTVTWSSSDPSVATVSSVGLITGVAAGSATLVATSDGQRASVVVRTLSATSPSVPLAASWEHACGIAAGGGAACWGRGEWFGVYGTTVPFGNAQTTATAVPGAVQFTAIAPGWRFTCGLASDAAGYCWGGNNDDGAQGNGTLTASQAPARISGAQTYREIEGGRLHACGLSTAGVAYCWGGSAQGQLGDGTTTTRLVPTPVAGALTFTRLAVGDDHACGLTPAGTAYCWGSALSGELGRAGGGTTESAYRPDSIAGGRVFIGLALGSLHSCGLESSGAAVCWGGNWAGQLGDGTTTARLPVPVNTALRFVQLAEGTGHTCGLTALGAAYCWGQNDNGQLGDGSTTTRLSPVAVSGSRTFVSISGARYTTCGRTASGAIYCWGQNADGQLGDGTLTDRTAPVLVTGR
jgi:hypothetical protein